MEERQNIFTKLLNVLIEQSEQPTSSSFYNEEESRYRIRNLKKRIENKISRDLYLKGHQNDLKAFMNMSVRKDKLSNNSSMRGLPSSLKLANYSNRKEFQE